MNNKKKLQILLRLAVVGLTACLWFFVLFPGKPIPLKTVEAAYETPTTEIKAYPLELERYVEDLHFRIQSDLQQSKVQFQVLDPQGKQLVQWINSDNQTTTFRLIHGHPAGLYSIRAEGQNLQGRYRLEVTIPPRWTQWQAFIMLMGLYIAGLGALTVWQSRRRKGLPPTPAMKLTRYIFSMTLFAILSVPLYLILHEGGHALVGWSAGRLDWSGSDIFGMRGTPHVSYRGSDVPPAEWVLSLGSIAGPLLPTLAGYLLFGIWRSGWGQKFRSRSRERDLGFSFLTAYLLFPHIATLPVILGWLSDGDYNGFIGHFPFPKWTGDGFLLLVFLINGWMVYTIVRHAIPVFRDFKKTLAEAPPAVPADPALSNSTNISTHL